MPGRAPQPCKWAGVALLCCCLLLPGCTFRPPTATPLPLDPGDVPLAPLIDATSTPVFVDPGAMQVYHGRGCAETAGADLPTILRVRQSQAIPRSLDHAMVLLNGWRLSYFDGDHEIQGLGTGILTINRRPLDDANHLLEWEAYGALFDQNGDDPYRWCYHFTVVAWDDDSYRASVAQRDSLAFQEQPPVDPGRWTTALAVQPGYVDLAAVLGSRRENVTVVPRGFAFIWAQSDDHNLLQLAYDLAPGDRYVAADARYHAPPPALAGSDRVAGFWSWESKTVFKDNALRRDYYTGEIVSVVAGPGTRSVHPPFTLVPQEDRRNCVSLGEANSDGRVIEGVPFDVAIPVLTGWDLSYVCDDEHVAEIGVWLDGFTYTPGEHSGQGRLEYLVHYRLKDEDGGNANRFRHRMSLLGFYRTKEPPPPPSASLTILPELLRFPTVDHRGRPAILRNVFIDNFGNAPATRSAIGIAGPDAAFFRLEGVIPASRTIGPGESEDYRLRFDIPCSTAPDPSHSWQATLRIETSEGPFEVPMIGREYPCL